MTIVLDDETVRARLDARDAVRWMGEAIDASHQGLLVTPPRTSVDLGDGRVIFTAGRLRGSWFGYRSYDTISGADQLVAVFDESSGRLFALGVGGELGPRRTGAIGAVAVDTMARSDASVLALLGSGTQAWTQLWAINAVRSLSEVRVFSPNEGRRDEFVQRARAVLGAPCVTVDEARAAVEGAAIVVLATSSATPVIKAQWLEPAAFVSTLGPKQQGRAEFGLDLAAAATVLATDSLAQIDDYEPANVLAGTPHRDRLVSLGDLRAHEVEVGAGVRAFFSVGLAGTEAFLLERLARRSE